MAFRVLQAVGGRCSTRSRCRSSPTPSPTRASARRRSACGARCSASRWRSGRSWAARSCRRSAGGAIFWINIPVGLAAIVLTLRFVPESRAPRPRRFDPVGQALVIVLLATLTFGIIEAPGRGWTSPVIVAAFAAAAPRSSACCSTSRAARSRSSTCASSARSRSRRRSSSRSPRSPRSAGSCSSTRSTCRRCAASRRCRPGSRPCRWPLMTVVASPLSGRIVGRRGPRLPLVVAGACW